jgi:hypothetical protein
MENCRMNKREFLGTALAASALPGALYHMAVQA